MEQAVARRAMGVETAVLGMAVFLMVEAMFFAGLVSAVVVGRVASHGWPPAGQAKAPPSAAGAAALLLAAGAASLRSRSATRAAGCGVAFLVVQAAVVMRLLGGLRLPTNTYAGLVLAVLGIHALHVLGGVIALARADAARLRVCSMYWLFLAGAWPVIALAVCL